MDFASVISVLVVYCIRPQEWINFTTALKPVQLTAALALVCMVFRHRGFHWRDLLQTPHDWIILFYLIWMVGSHPNPIDNFQSCCSVFIFYIVTVQALSDVRRIQTYLSWWTLLILTIAALAVAGEFGFDPTYSKDITHGLMKGRLILNLSIFNNPNALGHSVLPAVFTLYFLLFWKRPVFLKIATVPLALLPLFCLYLTASKGAFVAIFIVTVLALSFGRPIAVQVLVLVAAMTIGWTVLWTLPRMGELGGARTDMGIQGRVAAFRFGLSTLKTDINGLGQGKFGRTFYERFRFAKAAHSSYVCVGAEQGLPGLFLFTGILFTCMRSLWEAKTRDETEERVRRILFAMLAAYAVSSWMVDFAYRGSLFLLAAAIAAFHRQMLPVIQPAALPVDRAELEQLQPALVSASVLPFGAAEQTGLPILAQSTKFVLPAASPLTPGLEPVEEAQPPGLLWDRMHWTDWAWNGGFTFLVILFWSYIMRFM